MDQHLLSLVLFTPLAGLAVLLLIPSRATAALKIWANVAAFAGFLVSLLLVLRFDHNVAGYQFAERADWIPSLGVTYAHRDRRHQPAAHHAHHGDGVPGDPLFLECRR